jgi:hypothetical protein
LKKGQTESVYDRSHQISINLCDRKGSGVHPVTHSKKEEDPQQANPLLVQSYYQAALQCENPGQQGTVKKKF